MRVRIDRVKAWGQFGILGILVCLGALFAQVNSTQDQSNRYDRSANQQNNQYEQRQNQLNQGQRGAQYQDQSSDRYQQQATDRSQRQSSDRSANYSERQSYDRGQSGQDRSRSQQDVAWLGVFLQDMDNSQGGAQQGGVQVAQVYPAGPAARGGLRPGDIITQIDGQRINSSSDLISNIEQHQPGSQVQLAVQRNNQQSNINATLGSRSSFMWSGGQSTDQQSGGNNWQSGGQGGQYAQSGGNQYRSNSQGWSDDHWGSVPPFAMNLEHDRRMAEQHQRIETELAKLQEEVRQLREAIQQMQRR